MPWPETSSETTGTLDRNPSLQRSALPLKLGRGSPGSGLGVTCGPWLWCNVRPVTAREERLARNEATARDLNERIEQSHVKASREGYIRMLCECADPACDRVIAISLPEYESVRRDGRRFVVADGHVCGDIEQVMSETDRFTIVEKRSGTPAEVAQEEDPRA